MSKKKKVKKPKVETTATPTIKTVDNIIVYF